MLNKSPSVPPVIAVGIICLVAGAVLGYGVHDPNTQIASATLSNDSKIVALPSRGGGQSGGGSQQPTSGATLTRMVRGMDMLQKAQNKGLTPGQTQQLLPLLQSMQSADKLPEAQCATQLAVLEKTLTPDQKQALTDLQPQRGGGGGAGSGGGGKLLQKPGAGMSGGGGGSNGAQQDADRPFASERNKQALEDLIARLGAKK